VSEERKSEEKSKGESEKRKERTGAKVRGGEEKRT